jgi:hypothetical protein
LFVARRPLIATPRSPFVDANRSPSSERGVRHQPDLPYGVFELEPGVLFRHLSRPWIDELFSAFERVEFIEVPVTTMNGNRARGFQYLGVHR